MRQQESNQFDKGIALDTNPIAMDNHTMSGALNATMITMNGNELVLQNDMGNGRVESAMLPDGFVPVGMQEHGGIVYVASYNPLTDESQIGSFPSPERNISTSDFDGYGAKFESFFIKDNKDGNGAMKKTYETLPAIAGVDDNPIIRPGDKIKIGWDEAAKPDNNYEQYYLVSKDADGSMVKVKDIDFNSEGNSTGYFYYTGKAGQLYIAHDLNIMSYITASFEAVITDDALTITAKPKAWIQNYESEDYEWECEEKDLTWDIEFDYVEKPVGRSSEPPQVESKYDKSVQLSLSALPEQLSYEITPSIKGFKIPNKAIKGIINPRLIGTGEVEFLSFRYFNNVSNNRFDLEYVMNSYLSEQMRPGRFVLELFQYNSSGVDIPEASKIDSSYWTTHNSIFIPLNESNNFGSFTQTISYVDEGVSIQAGQMFIGRLLFEVRQSKTSQDDTPMIQASDNYVIITADCANDYYMQHPDTNMFELVEEQEKAAAFTIPYKVKWSKTVRENNTQLVNLKHDMVTPDPMPTSINKEQFFAAVAKEGSITVKFKPEIEINTALFPLETEVELNCSLVKNTENGQPVKPSYINNLTQASVVQFSGQNMPKNSKDNTDELPESSQSGDIDEKPIEFQDTKLYNSVAIWSTSKYEDSNSEIQFNFQYRLPSYLAAAIGNGGNPITYQNFDCPAFVPFLDINIPDSQDKLSKIFGQELYQEGTSYYPANWFTFHTWEGSKNSRHRVIVMSSADSSENARNQHAGTVSGQGEANDYGSYTIFDTTSTNANWKFYSKSINSFLNNDQKIYPAMLLWQGNTDSAGSSQLGVSNLYSTNKHSMFSMPMMLGTNGDWYVLNMYKTGSGSGGTLLSALFDEFKNIYIYQEGQTVQFDYYKADESKYAYTDSYSIPIKIDLAFTPTVTSKVNNQEYIGKIKINNKDYFGPQFNLAETNRTTSQTIEISSYDASELLTTYLDAAPSLSTVAAIPTYANGVTTTTIVNTPQPNSPVPFNPNSVYLKQGNNTFVDLIAASSISPSSGIAKAIKDKLIKPVYDSNLETYVLRVNSSVAGSKKATSLNGTALTSLVIAPGTEKVTKLGDIATNHIIKVY